MNKQSPQLSPSPTDTTDSSPLLHKQSSPTKPANACSGGISPEKTDSDPPTEQSDKGISPSDEDSLPSEACGDSPVETASFNEGNQPDRLSSHSTENLSEERQPQEAVVEYEYMDIRTETQQQNAAAGESVANSGTSNPDATASDVREAVYQNLSELPRLRTAESGRQKASNIRLGEYVDMEANEKPCCEGDQPEYQNIPVKGRPVVGEESQKNSLRSCIKVYKGIEEQSTSFDNPDYWHSRLFHKQDAVCT